MFHKSSMMICMNTQRFTVSVDKELAEFLDSYQKQHQVTSRSEVIAKAIKLLRECELGRAYHEAGLEWAESEDANLWERTSADGLESR
jgi:Arc/MetJ-type ribon-helix-helix transcriptional regulator